MSDPTRQFQHRFILHLVTALQERLVYGGIPLHRSFLPLHVIFSNAEPEGAPDLDLHAVTLTLAKIIDDWKRQQKQEPVLTDEVQMMITQALALLAQMVDQVLSGAHDRDDFVGVVFQC